MQVVEKHGGHAHLLRPDRVYKTGVLSPWFTFAPGQDVQAVAASFTEQPMSLMVADSKPGKSGDISGLALAGVFGAAGASNWFDRMRLRFDAWRTKMTAKLATKKAVTAQVKAMKATAQAANAQASAQGQAHGQPFADRGGAFHPALLKQGMAYAQVGTQVAPHMMGQVGMLARLTAGSLPRAAAEAQTATVLERWHNMRWNG